MIKLPVTPASVWVSPTSGRLFAALPATNRVAVLDTALARSPILMTRVGAKPIAVAGAPAATGGSTGIYVVNVGDRTITTLDALTGRAITHHSDPGAAEPARSTAPREKGQRDTEGHERHRHYGAQPRQTRPRRHRDQ